MTASSTPNHIPVMPNEVLSLMDLKPRGKYVDGTCGLGGHAGMILSSLSKKGFLLGLDIDKDAIKICKKRLDNFSSNFHIEKKSYSELSSILKILEIGQVDGILLDLGLSSLQLDSQSRGFSFKESSSLDMRFDQDSRIDASRIINKSSESEIADIIYYYGEERRSRSIAKKIFQNRPINRVDQLVEVLKKCTPPHKRNKILARVFQSFRIAVNKELDNLSSFLEKYLDCLKVGGKIIIISFHSLEDRIVKRSFKESSRKGQLNIITKKPIIACEDERIKNSRSKSAKLRCAVKL
ncbi:16S rRNA (cytosine(1402)-N(4))-methyltransferase RsmH [bacterium]|nr:16S rRNA (cytosine(1402)-N(4))-methyltransferase RsmH [bacterium]